MQSRTAGQKPTAEREDTVKQENDRMEEASAEAIPSQDAPHPEEAPAVEEAPAIEEASAVEATPAVEEAPAVEATPAIEEAPAVEEAPAIEEAPAVEATPAVEEAPTIGELPTAVPAGKGIASSAVLQRLGAAFGKAAVLLTKKQVLAGLLAAVILASGIGIGLWIAGDGDGIDRGAVDYEWTPPEGTLGNADGIVLPGYDRILLPAGEERVALILPNPKGNPCNFRFTLRLTEGSEVLYRSGLIPPGMAMTEIELSRPLAAGDYPLEILIETYALSDASPLNGGSIRLTLEVR